MKATLSSLFPLLGLSYGSPLSSVKESRNGVTLNALSARGQSSSAQIAGQQQIAIASYIHPDSDADAWQRLIKYPQAKLSVLVANVLDGPDSAVNPAWNGVIKAASESGKTVLGYVRTGYLGFAGVGTEFDFHTRLGSLNEADWIAQIEADIDTWYRLYADSIGGIFFDEGWNECGAADTYAYLDRYTKQKYPGAFTVLNPGTSMPQCFEHTMDTLLTFEGDLTRYTDNFNNINWVPQDIRKIWHIVYQTPESEINRAASLALERNAGLLHLTDDIGGMWQNPYDNLPGDAYMQKQLSAVEGGKPLVETKSFPAGPQAATPSSLSVVSSDYSSVKLSWSRASNAIGYQVYAGSDVYLSLPPTVTEVTAGGLNPDTSYTFRLAAIGGNGDESSLSSPVTQVTKALPGGNTVANYSSAASASSTTIKADFLVPYFSARLFLWDEAGCDVSQVPAWPVNVGSSIVCARYMVEGQNLYRYNGQPPYPGSAPWAWEAVPGAVTLTKEGYTRTWGLPIGTSTFDTSKFVIQADGYGPSTVIVQPRA